MSDVDVHTHLAPRAICHRCGGPKKGPFVPCKVCTFTPIGEQRAVAWLFSDEYLSEEEMAEARDRIRAGERPDPSRALQEMARTAMGARPLSNDQLRPMTNTQLASLVLANLLLTPLAGLAVWYGYRERRPVAARQAGWATVPVALSLAVAWGVVLIRQIAPG
ncbi:MAG: hypothetical protein AAFV53_10535 [Myxococcota bacterium]